MVRNKGVDATAQWAVQNFNVASHALENCPRNCQAYAQALIAAAISLAGLIKTFKDFCLYLYNKPIFK